MPRLVYDVLILLRSPCWMPSLVGNASCTTRLWTSITGACNFIFLGLHDPVMDFHSRGMQLCLFRILTVTCVSYACRGRVFNEGGIQGCTPRLWISITGACNLGLFDAMDAGPPSCIPRLWISITGVCNFDSRSQVDVRR